MYSEVFLLKDVHVLVISRARLPANWDAAWSIPTHAFTTPTKISWNTSERMSQTTTTTPPTRSLFSVKTRRKRHPIDVSGSHCRRQNQDAFPWRRLWQHGFRKTLQSTKLTLKFWLWAKNHSWNTILGSFPTTRNRTSTRLMNAARNQS